MPYFFPPVIINNFVVTNGKKIGSDTAIPTKIPKSLQKTKQCILKYFFGIFVSLYFRQDMPAELGRKLLIKGGRSVSVMGKKRAMRVASFMKFRYFSIIDVLRANSYLLHTDMIERVFAESLKIWPPTRI